MKPAKSGAENGEILLSSTAIEQYLPATEKARLLKLSDNELTRLVRSAVLRRSRDPCDSRAYVYPVWQNVRAYILHVRGRKEAARSPKNRSTLPRLWATRTSSPLPIRRGSGANSVPGGSGRGGVVTGRYGMGFGMGLAYSWRVAVVNG
jgi:hypothetical protein